MDEDDDEYCDCPKGWSWLEAPLVLAAIALCIWACHGCNR